jgi:dTDP-4-dehydrorhamnose reductase
MRVLVTGAAGQLGLELMSRLAVDGHEPVGVDLGECDIAVPGAARATLDRHRPVAVINCAAYTAVDRAEGDRDAAFRANAAGPELLAAACAGAGVRLIHISTDFVFDGTAGAPIPEDAEPHPLGVYAESKLAGEEAVRAAGGDHVIVRTSWLFGRRGPNFVLTIRRLAETRTELTVVADQWGSPTWTGDLAPALIRLASGTRRGTYHLTNQGQTTWHGLAEAIVAEGGLATAVRAVTTQEYPTAARRPRYSVLDNRAWREDGETPLPEWRSALRSYLGELAAASPARP